MDGFTGEKRATSKMVTRLEESVKEINSHQGADMTILQTVLAIVLARVWLKRSIVKGWGVFDRH
jgi:hypothetical protein